MCKIDLNKYIAESFKIKNHLRTNWDCSITTNVLRELDNTDRKIDPNWLTVSMNPSRLVMHKRSIDP